MVFYTLAIGILAKPFVANAAPTIGYPTSLGFQGRLKDDVGDVVADADYDFRFRLYDNAAATTDYIYADDVAVVDGFFSLEIPLGTDIGDIAFNPELEVGTVLSAGAGSSADGLYELFATRITIYKSPFSVFTQAIQNSAADPASAFEGEMYYDTDDDTLKYYDGASFVTLGASGIETLDDAYNNFGADAQVITVDDAVTGLEFDVAAAGDMVVDLSSTGDFIVQNAGVAFATFTDEGGITFGGPTLLTLATTGGNVVLDAQGAATNVVISAGVANPDAGEDENDVAIEAVDDILAISLDDIILTAGNALNLGTSFGNINLTSANINFYPSTSLLVNTTGTIEMDADGTSHFATSVGDLSFESETGSVGIYASEAVADAILLSSSAGGIDINSTGDITLDSTGGAISIDAAGASNLSTSLGDLTLSAIDVGTDTGDVILVAGNGAPVTAADGNDIELLAEEDVVLGANGGFSVDVGTFLDLTSYVAAIDAITLTASDLAGGIDINAGSGGVTMDAIGGAISIDAAGASNLSTSLGDLTLSAIDVGTDTGDVILVAGNGAPASAADGNDIELLAEGSFVVSTNDFLNIYSAKNLSTAINIQATHDDGGVQLGGGLGGVNVGTTGEFTVSANGISDIQSQDGLTLQTSAGTLGLYAGPWIDIGTTDGNGFISIAAGTNGMTIDSGAGISIDSVDTTNLTMTASDPGTKTMTLAATNGGAGVANMDISADGGITMDAGTGDITLNSDDDIFLNPSGTLGNVVATLPNQGSFMIDASTTTHIEALHGVLDVDVTVGDSSPVSGSWIHATQSDTAGVGNTVVGQRISLQELDADGIMYGLLIGTSDGSGVAGTFPAGIKVDNGEDIADSMTDGILITSSGINNGVTNGINVSDAFITNAINIGANAIAGTNFSVNASGNITGTFAAATNDKALCHEGGAGATDAIEDCTAAATADYAEKYPTAPGITYGQIVVPGSTLIATQDNNHGSQQIAQAILSSTPYQGPIYGVVSNNYGDFTSAGNNIAELDNPMPVALVGRVPVSVVNENGSIAIGDFLATSSTPGAAMKATQAGRVIGMALENWNGEKDTVMVQVINTWYQPPVADANDLQGGNANAVVVADNITATDASFTGSVTVAEHLYGSRDMAGRARLNAGDNTVRVTFETPYDFQPVVTFSPRSEELIPGRVWVSSEDETGFTLNHSAGSSTAYPLEFNWIAVGVEEALVTVSDGTTERFTVNVVEQPLVEEVLPEEQPVVDQPVVEELVPVVEELPIEELPLEQPIE